MRIGLVCEGPTDYVFIHGMLKQCIPLCDVIPLQPNTDNTKSQKGGWTLVRDWLLANPLRTRQERYLSGGLFDNGLDPRRCDAMLIHLDADVLDSPEISHDDGFRDLRAMPDRTAAAEALLQIWADWDSMSEVLRQLHVLAVATQSTESWCVAIFQKTDFHPDDLTGLELAHSFMRTILLSESRDAVAIDQIDKSVERRRRYCSRNLTRENLFRFGKQSLSLARVLEKIEKLS